MAGRRRAPWTKGAQNRIGAMVLAHQRPWLLPLIARQCAVEWPDSVVHVTVDRPSAAVIAALAQAKDLHPKLTVFEAPFSPVGDRERWMELRQWQLEKMHEEGVEYAAIWDDDHILERPTEVKQYLRAGYDMIYIRKLFLWNQLNMQNTEMPEHNSVFFFHLLPGDKFPLDRMIHAPAGIHDNPLSRKVCLQSKLLDVGYLFQEDRERVFKLYARAGKLDAATLPLANNDPILKEIRKSQGRKAPWYVELQKVMAPVCRDHVRRKNESSQC